MNFPQTMSIIAGLLQFVVAGYALRLNRIFGTARVGWSLFWAFALLALLHFFQSVVSFGSGVSLGSEIEVIYALISLLLLTGLVILRPCSGNGSARGGGEAFARRSGIAGQ